MNHLIPLNQKQKSLALTKLKTTSPREVTEKVVSSLKLTHNLKIEEQVSKDFDLLGYKLKDIEDLSTEQLVEAEKTIQFSMVALPIHEIEKELLKTVAVMVKPSGETAEDVAFRVKCIAEELSHYPADIMLHTCKVIKSSGNFFPTLYEFKNVGDWHYEKRKNLLDIVQKSIKQLESNA